MNAPEPVRQKPVEKVPLVSGPRASVAVAAPGHGLKTYIGTAVKRAGPTLDYQMNRVGRSGAAGATILLFAAIFLFSTVLPQQRQLLALDDQIRQARHLNSASDTAPVRLNRFINALPRRSELPKILGQVFVLARTEGVTLDRGRYEMSPTRTGRLAQYRMSFPIKGHYPAIRKFIDSVLATVPSAALEGLRVDRKAVGEASVAADLRFSIFVRNDT